MKEIKHTNALKHLVALVEHEHPDATKTQVLVANKGVQTTRGTDDNVGVGLRAAEDGNVLGDLSTTVEDAGADLGHVLGETVVLVANLEGQLTSVAQNEDGALAVDGLDLLKGRQHENGRLTGTGLGLADDVTANEGLGNACLLDCRVARSYVRITCL